MKLAAAVAVIAAGLLQAVFPSSATAGEMTWVFQNDHDNVVSVELYSDDRNHVWPGNDEVYTLDDGRARRIRIACQSGEKICYGAWVRNTASAQWGAGRGGKGECSRCCYTCDGGTTPTLVLD